MEHLQRNTLAANAGNKTKLLYLVLIALCTIFWSACQKEAADSSSAGVDGQALASKNAAATENGGMTTSTICFRAIAQISACNEGEDILFFGEIENHTKTTISNGQTHVTRHFVVKNLEGRGISPGGSLSAMTCSSTFTGTYTGSEYDVQGGAEMFNIHFGEGGTATPAGSAVYIHRGTLVFVERETGRRVVARHIITKVPGQGIKDNRWACGGSRSL